MDLTNFHRGSTNVLQPTIPQKLKRRFHSSDSLELRSSTVISRGFFLSTIHDAMDSFSKDWIGQVRCNSSILLQLPIRTLFANTPSDHWLQRRTKTRTQVWQFFTFDQTLHHICHLLYPDSPSFPRLSERFVRELQNSTVFLNDTTWSLILTDSEAPNIVDDRPFVHSFTTEGFRSAQLDCLPPIPVSSLTKQQRLFFCSLPMLPEARSLWFRMLHNKVYHQSLIAPFSVDISASCSHFSLVSEDMAHFPIKYPNKWPVWELILSRQTPYLSFNPDDIQAVLFSLKQYDYVYNPLLFVLCSSILLCIWRAHWCFVFGQIPINIDLILDQAFLKYSLLFGLHSKHASH
jgi:hypothetical protein